MGSLGLILGALGPLLTQFMKVKVIDKIGASPKWRVLTPIATVAIQTGGELLATHVGVNPFDQPGMLTATNVAVTTTLHGLYRGATKTTKDKNPWE